MQRKNNYHRFLFYCILIFSASLHAHPDFVKNLKFKELKVNIPEAHKEQLTDQITYYSIKSARFPITFLTISIKGGESHTANSKPEVPELISSCLKFGGSKSFPEEKLLSQLESMGAKLNIVSGRKYISIQVSFLTRDAKEVMALVKQLILEPSFTEKAFQKAKKDMLEDIRRRNDRTNSVAFRKAKELVFRSVKTGREPSIQSLQSIRKQKLLEYWQSIVKNNRKIIRVVGKFHEDSLKKEIQSIFSQKNIEQVKYSKENITEKDLNNSFLTLKPKVYLVNKKVNQSMVLMLGILPAHNHPDFFALQLLNYIIGGSGFNSYLMQQIRVERGLAYSANSFPVFRDKYGVFYAYSMTKNKSLIEVYNLMKKILDKPTFEKIQKKELDKAKEAINNQFVFLFSDKMKIINNQLRFDEDNMPADYLQTYRKKINQVSLQDIKRVGDKYFSYRNLKTIIISPESTVKGKFPAEYKVISPEYVFPAK